LRVLVLVGRVRSHAESFFKHGSSVRHSIELIGKTRKGIFASTVTG
jgi:hypothetical protein